MNIKVNDIIPFFAIVSLRRLDSSPQPWHNVATGEYSTTVLLPSTLPMVVKYWTWHRTYLYIVY
jgi:hypothetical protein